MRRSQMQQQQQQFNKCNYNADEENANELAEGQKQLQSRATDNCSLGYPRKVTK